MTGVIATLHKYEIALTATLTYDEKCELGDFLAEIADRRGDRFHGAMVSRYLGSVDVEDFAVGTLRTVAGTGVDADYRPVGVFEEEK